MILLFFLFIQYLVGERGVACGTILKYRERSEHINPSLYRQMFFTLSPPVRRELSHQGSL